MGEQVYVIRIVQRTVISGSPHPPLQVQYEDVEEARPCPVSLDRTRAGRPVPLVRTRSGGLATESDGPCGRTRADRFAPAGPFRRTRLGGLAPDVVGGRHQRVLTGLDRILLVKRVFFFFFFLIFFFGFPLQTACKKMTSSPQDFRNDFRSHDYILKSCYVFSPQFFPFQAIVLHFFKSIFCQNTHKGLAMGLAMALAMSFFDQKAT